MHALVLAALTTRLDGAHILNSGSTNTAAYEILVWSDGNTRTISKSATVNVRITPIFARKFLNDAKKARAGTAAGEPCMKSASFGSRTTVTYHGWTSPDVSCPSQDALAAIGADAAEIARLTSAGGPRRITLPPNEPRRLPESTPTPTPTS